MKINNIDTTRLRNDAHFQFHADIIKLVNDTGADALKIAALWAAHTALFASLDTTLKKIVMSANSPKIQDADRARDELYVGFKKFLAGLCDHYDATMRDAALKVQVVVHTYSNVTAKSLSEETGAIYNLARELRSDKYKDLVAQLGLTQWVAKIELQNAICATLIQVHDRGNTGKPHTSVIKERRALDESYKHIVDIINAQLLLGQLTGAEAFVNTANEIIHRYASMRHRHRHGAHISTPLNDHGGEMAGNVAVWSKNAQ